MTKSKTEVSQSYTKHWHDRTKDYKLPDIRSRRAVVFGSDRKSNIGEGIATELMSAGIPIVREEDVTTTNLTIDTHCLAFPFRQYDTIVLANGSTHLDWIENQNFSNIEAVIADKLVASIRAVSEFVDKTLNLEYIKNIVLIGSMAASSVLNGSAPYCAASAGLQHFARCVAWELAPKGYRVFLINPSNTEGTPMTEATIQGLQSYRGLTREEAEEYWGAVQALPRWLNRRNIGEIVAWLVTTDSAEWLSGTPLNLGGGLR